MAKYEYRGRQTHISAGGIVFARGEPVDIKSPTADQLRSFERHDVHRIRPKPKAKTRAVYKPVKFEVNGYGSSRD